MGKYAVTLYDLIGYLVPGMMGFAVVGIGQSLYDGNLAFIQEVLSIPLVWVLFVAYLLGQVIQALSRLCIHMKYSVAWTQMGIRQSILDKVYSKLSEVTGETVTAADVDKDLVKLMEKSMDEQGGSKFDVLKAAGGFSRALVFVFALSCLLSFLFALCSADDLAFSVLGNRNPGVVFSVSGLILGGLAILFYGRYRRFKVRVVETVVIAFFATLDDPCEGRD